MEKNINDHEIKYNSKLPTFHWFRALLCILLPPFAVIDYGCGSFVLVFLLTLSNWIPGTLAAALICAYMSKDGKFANYVSNSNIKLIWILGFISIFIIIGLIFPRININLNPSNRRLYKLINFSHIFDKQIHDDLQKIK